MGRGGRGKWWRKEGAGDVSKKGNGTGGVKGGTREGVRTFQEGQGLSGRGKSIIPFDVEGEELVIEGGKGYRPPRFPRTYGVLVRLRPSSSTFRPTPWKRCSVAHQ